MTLRRVLIANRGEIAVRIVRACQARGIETVLAVSEVDRTSLAARMADRTVCVGPARASDSYLNAPALVTAALGVGADAIHPGYGFLSENAAFAGLAEDNGLRFIGPDARTIALMGSKVASRAAAIEAGVDVLPASPPVRTVADARRWMQELGGPVLVKASAGGGGRGIRRVLTLDEVGPAVEQARSEAGAAFGDDTVYLERLVLRARHVEVQVFGDGRGGAIHLGERDCTIQRRHQKVMEEAPARALPEAAVAALRTQAVALAASIGYRGAGTVEFVHDADAGLNAFLEMNTRIQVEHPVTEAVTGRDLIGMQLDLAGGDETLPEQSTILLAGHAIECRIAAEVPEQGFRPSPGTISAWSFPVDPRVRVDSGVETGSEVGPHYDSMIAKVIVHGDDRDDALARMRSTLEAAVIEGIGTNLTFLRGLVAHPDVTADDLSTTWLDDQEVVAALVDAGSRT
jgi:acetyl-CoA carboxylase, biotin carboxylase subunit